MREDSNNPMGLIATVDSTITLISLLEPIRLEMEQVERLLYETVGEVGGPLGAGLRYLLGSGKRVRPALAILTGQLYAPSTAPFYSLGAAVEMLHSATLIHDDLVDDAAMRRGRRTLHTTWPVGATVLAGDYLMAKSAYLIADLGRPRILKIFADTLCTLCAGEIRESLADRGQRASREEYYSRIEAKTSSLCAATMDMAGILAGAEEVHLAALRCFGRELGVAFQIVDDVLDFVGDEARLGKPAGSDLRQGLVTLPAICHLEMAGDGTAVDAVLDGQRDETHVQAAIAAVRASGAIEVALAEAHAHIRRGQEALATLPDGTARQLLGMLTEFVMERGC